MQILIEWVWRLLLIVLQAVPTIVRVLLLPRKVMRSFSGLWNIERKMSGDLLFESLPIKVWWRCWSGQFSRNVGPIYYPFKLTSENQFQRLVILECVDIQFLTMWWQQSFSSIKEVSQHFHYFNKSWLSVPLYPDSSQEDDSCQLRTRQCTKKLNW
jgi:hypothetical protein